MSKLLSKPGLLSTSSVSSLDQVLMSTLEDFYDPKEHPKHLEAFEAVLSGKSPVSLRSLEHLVTNYARRTGLSYVHQGVVFNVYDEYQAQLASFTKNNFDPFQRGKKTKKIVFRGVETTICQLNYFRWVLRNGLLEYCLKHTKAIREDMLRSSKKRAENEDAPRRRREQAKSKSKECHVAHAAFTHSFD